MGWVGFRWWDSASERSNLHLRRSQCVLVSPSHPLLTKHPTPQHTHTYRNKGLVCYCFQVVVAAPASYVAAHAFFFFCLPGLPLPLLALHPLRLGSTTHHGTTHKCIVFTSAQRRGGHIIPLFYTTLGQPRTNLSRIRLPSLPPLHRRIPLLEALLCGRNKHGPSKPRQASLSCHAAPSGGTG